MKVRPDGTVKVLDFGLAKAMEPAAGSSPSVSQSPTITTPAMTGMGVILGTAAYMSPEQAKGKPVDKRADIWALGCVLFEMLSGKRAFEGEDVSDTLAAVLRGQPDWKALPLEVFEPIRTLVQRCLEKDRRARISDIAVVKYVLVEGTSTAAAKLEPERRLSGWRRALPWAAAGALGFGLAAVIVLWAPWRTVPPSSPLRLEAGMGADASLMTDPGAAMALSPDGGVLAFVARQNAGERSQLYVRRLEQLQATPLSGTVGATSPFFSPDGQWIGFFADGKLKKISVNGGAAVTLCDAPAGRGGSWAEDGTIAFSPDVGQGGEVILRVSSAGGTPDRLTTVGDGEITQRWPQLLAGGKAVLYTGHSSGVAFDNANLVVQALPAGARKVVQRGGYHGRYLPSGHLVYIHEGTLFAAPFDLDRLELTGQPVPALEGVTTLARSGGAEFAVSGNGTLVYLPGESVNTANLPIQWMARDGKTMPLRTTPANWFDLHFAPDGRRLAVTVGESNQSDVWVYEWARDTLTRLTFDAATDRKPVWTPDSRRIVFGSARGNNSTTEAPGRSGVNLYWQNADGTGDVQRLTESKNLQAPTSWHPSGKFLAFQEQNLQTTNSPDLMILPMEGDDVSGWKPGKPTVFLNSPFPEAEAMFSPDGRWLAYVSVESGRAEVYVQPFPGPGGKWLISTSGGNFPIWSLARRELFYNTPGAAAQIMVASYTVDGDSFRADKPRPWSEARHISRQGTRMFDLHPDGERFALSAMPETQTETTPDKVVFIFNFFDELRQIAPVTR